MKKRGQGNMFWIIGTMVLVLIVVLILGYVFSDKIGIFSSEVQRCDLKGGVCKESCSASEYEVRNTGCSGSTPKCCVGVFENEEGPK